MPIKEWRSKSDVGERGAKNFDLTSIFDRVEIEKSGHGCIKTRIPRSGLDFYAGRLIALGEDVKVELRPNSSK